MSASAERPPQSTRTEYLVKALSRHGAVLSENIVNAQVFYGVYTDVIDQPPTGPAGVVFKAWIRTVPEWRELHR